MRTASQSTLISGNSENIDKRPRKEKNERTMKPSAFLFKTIHAKNWGAVRQKLHLPPKKHCTGKPIKDVTMTNALISQSVQSGDPLFYGRIGMMENSILIDHEFIQKGAQKSYSDYVIQWSKRTCGMFSTTPEGFDIFCQRMQNAIRHMTIFRTWGLKMEPYWIRHYCKGDVVLSNGYGFGDAGSSAFSACLKGRRVLVVSSFAETIKSQYKKREFIYPSSDTLPAFDLKVVQAPVTNADAIPQFKTWEETLLDLFRRCMKQDFEIALIGAGSYSLPLGDLLFQSGKQVIVMNAHIQLLFGIKGGRWDANQAWGHYNESWVRPSPQEVPPNSKIVDFGKNPYW
jgi:hypothetical protein